MTTDRTPMEHPTDLELAAWADEPGTPNTAVGAHVQGCVRCAAELRALDETRAALALDPPIPTPEAFAAQRSRILTAISAGPPREGRVVARIAWLAPIAAAAAIAAFLLVGRTGGPGSPDAPYTPGEIAADSEAVALPIVADAAAAAEEAADAIATQEDPASDVTIVPSEAIDEELLDAALAAAEPLAPPIAVERSLTTELLFAELPEDEQSAVLLELASADLDY